MSGYLSSILTTTTSRYNSLRRTLLSDENDGDTEDDSHISRVLRAYYSEKGRPFPPWLPPDPKAPQPAPTPFMSVSAGRQGPPPQPQAIGRGGGGLSDLWDTPQQSAPQPGSMSLRRGAQGRNPGRPAPIVGGGDSYQSVRPGVQSPEQRPLPSQRQGSYQTSFSQNARVQAEESSASRPVSASSGTTAQERLKARLLGGARSTSPSQSPLPSPGLPPGEQRNPYDRGSSRQGGARGGENPYVGASAPWSSTGSDNYSSGGPRGPSGGGSQGEGQGYGRRPGPAPGQGRTGFPSGPRPM